MSGHSATDFAPVKVLEVELSESLVAVRMNRDEANGPYLRAQCLVRLHGYPVGVVWLESRAGTEYLSADELTRQIWHELSESIVAHLHTDTLAVPNSLPLAGLRSQQPPRCVVEREELRNHAPPATVVVATRERPQSLRRCLASLLALDYPQYEIVVVDNAPETSATRELLLGEPFRTRIRYVRENQPGLAAAHNCGLAHAQGSFVAFTDDDVTVDNSWLLELARGFRLTDRVGCVTGLIMPAELETPAQLIAEQIWGWSKGFSERVFDWSTRADDPLYPYAAGTFGSGANMAFDTAALRAMGGFDAATGVGTLARGGDDLSGFFLVVSSGDRLVYNPAAIVRHAHPAGYEQLRRQAYGYGVGLTAYLTKIVLDRPVRAVELGRHAGHGIARACQPGAQRRNGRHPSLVWPADLAWAQRRGMVWGPVAYVRSRRRVRSQQATDAGD